MICNDILMKIVSNKKLKQNLEQLKLDQCSQLSSKGFFDFFKRYDFNILQVLSLNDTTVDD
jgi:hypothetical protein